MKQYKELQKGDLIQQGDEFYLKNVSQWAKTHFAGRKVGEPPTNYLYRRVMKKINHPNTKLFK